MVPAVRPLGPLSMARGCARIDSRPDTAKIGSVDRVEVHHARLLAVIGVRKTFPHGLDPKGTSAPSHSLPLCNVRRICQEQRASMLICRHGKSNFCIGLRQINPTGKSLRIIRNSVKPLLQKYFCFHLTQITSKSNPSRPTRGAIARRHERGAGCGGRGSVRRCQGMAGRVTRPVS